MLIKAELKDIEKYGDMAYSLALDPTKSCYPTYKDGIKTKADFLADAARAVTGETSELLLFVMNGTVEGWLAYDWIPMDKYLQLCACNINHGMEQALTELLEQLEKRFASYAMYFGFPGENLDAAVFLRAHGFLCIEEDWNFSFFFNGYKLQAEDQNIERITRDNFDAFRAVYHADPKTYWNCDRILGAIDDWIIFVYYDNGRPAATVFLQGDHGYYEIYGMEFAGGVWKEDIFRGLLTAGLNACKGLGAKYMTYFCGERETRILPGFGFQCVGRYVLYCKTLCGE